MSVALRAQKSALQITTITGDQLQHKMKVMRSKSTHHEAATTYPLKTNLNKHTKNIVHKNHIGPPLLITKSKQRFSEANRTQDSIPSQGLNAGGAQAL